MSYQRIQGQTQTDGGSYSYTYDDAGNITQIDKDGNIYASFVYDEHHQLVEEECYETLERIFYTYDGGGNPLSYRGWTMEWERGRQLTEMQKGSDSIAYQYDANGIRTQKTVNNVTTQYHWDGGKLIYQTDGTNSMRFYYDVNGELVGLWDSQDGTCYYVKDGQGNVIRIVGTYGQTIAEYAYDAYGNILSAPTSGVGARNPFRYRGYYYDTETGFYYLQSRYYDPEVSRFINADVVIGNESILGTNLFAYCFNNPANCFDDTGYWPMYYVQNNNININCYAYALGFSYRREVPRTSEFSPVWVVYDQVYRHLVYGLGIDAIKLGTDYRSKYWNSRTYFLIAMRSGRGGNAYLGDSGDYHFMVRHQDLTWSHKPGGNPSMYLGKVEPGMIPWHRYSWSYPYQKTIHNYYNSATYYIAVRKWTSYIHHGLWLLRF